MLSSRSLEAMKTFSMNSNGTVPYDIEVSSLPHCQGMDHVVPRTQEFSMIEIGKYYCFTPYHSGLGS